MQELRRALRALGSERGAVELTNEQARGLDASIVHELRAVDRLEQVVGCPDSYGARRCEYIAVYAMVCSSLGCSSLGFESHTERGTVAREEASHPASRRRGAHSLEAR